MATKRNAKLAFPFAAPTAYGLGKHGWVTFTFQTLTSKLESQCFAWLEESYVAVAPKSLGKTLHSKDSKARG
ncbi:MAG TPA: hypothetical protein VM099_06700 [Gemmatimonadaceae bacterium]|nr:hypothetical protein [Gemmatimonadaceae bacterium]